MKTDVSLLNLSFNFTGLTQSNQRVSLSTINFEKKKQQRPVRMQLKLSYSYQDTGHVFTRQGDFQVHLK